jgi:hypothetical protein
MGKHRSPVTDHLGADKAYDDHHHDMSLKEACPVPTWIYSVPGVSASGIL